MKCVHIFVVNEVCNEAELLFIEKLQTWCFQFVLEIMFIFFSFPCPVWPWWQAELYLNGFMMTRECESRRWLSGTTCWVDECQVMLPVGSITCPPCPEARGQPSKIGEGLRSNEVSYWQRHSSKVLMKMSVAHWPRGCQTIGSKCAAGTLVHRSHNPEMHSPTTGAIPQTQAQASSPHQREAPSPEPGAVTPRPQVQPPTTRPAPLEANTAWAPTKPAKQSSAPQPIRGSFSIVQHVGVVFFSSSWGLFSGCGVDQCGRFCLIWGDWWGPRKGRGKGSL